MPIDRTLAPLRCPTRYAILQLCLEQQGLRNRRFQGSLEERSPSKNSFFSVPAAASPPQVQRKRILGRRSLPRPSTALALTMMATSHASKLEAPMQQPLTSVQLSTARPPEEPQLPP